jgi:MFS family permease
MLRRLVPATDRPVLASRVFRRLILGFAVSYLDDAMSFVAVPWHAIELTPQATVGLWVGAAVAAYTALGVPVGLVFGRRLRRVAPCGCCSRTTWCAAFSSAPYRSACLPGCRRRRCCTSCCS